MGWRSGTSTTRLGALAVALATCGLATVAPAPTPARAATYAGSTARARLAAPIVGLAASAGGHGYWLAGSDGSVYAFGDARMHGSLRGRRLSAPIVGIAATPSGGGYWLVASDGGVFTFGNARFYGSAGNKHLTKPVVGIAASPTGHGYWLVASDGGIFTYGDVHFWGSTGNRRLAAPIVGMSRPNAGGGYWLVGRDGGVFRFGSAPFFGSAVGALGGEAAIGVAASPHNDGYWIASRAGAVDTGSPSGMKIDPNLLPNAQERAIAAELVTRINQERTARGRITLTLDPLLSSAAASWARYLAMHQQFVHQNLGTLLNRSNGRFSEVGENMFGGEGNGIMDAGTAHVVLMHSDGHRTNMLLPEERFVGVGVACINNEMIVVEDFAIPASLQLGSHPVPSLLPIAASNEGGASC